LTSTLTPSLFTTSQYIHAAPSDQGAVSRGRASLLYLVVEKAVFSVILSAANDLNYLK